MARWVLPRRPVIDRRARLMGSLVAALTLVFLLLALSLRRTPGTSVDLAVTTSVQRIEHALFAELMHAITALGFWPWDWLVLGTAMSGLWLFGFRRAALFLLATPLPGPLTRSIKELVARPRPGDDAVRVASELLDFSYPGGHVIGYVSLYGFLFFLTYVLFQRSLWRTGALWLFGLLIGLVGVSRIYLGHHWASDVLGGYAFGTAYLLMLIEAYRLTTITPAVASAQPPATRL